MIKSIKYWWMRVWTYRKSKWKMKMEKTIPLGHVIMFPSGSQALHIGKNYFNPIDNG